MDDVPSTSKVISGSTLTSEDESSIASNHERSTSSYESTKLKMYEKQKTSLPSSFERKSEGRSRKIKYEKRKRSLSFSERKSPGTSRKIKKRSSLTPDSSLESQGQQQTEKRSLLTSDSSLESQGQQKTKEYRKRKRSSSSSDSSLESRRQPRTEKYRRRRSSSSSDSSLDSRRRPRTKKYRKRRSPSSSDSSMESRRRRRTKKYRRRRRRRSSSSSDSSLESRRRPRTKKYRKRRSSSSLDSSLESIRPHRTKKYRKGRPSSRYDSPELKKQPQKKRYRRRSTTSSDSSLHRQSQRRTKKYQRRRRICPVPGCGKSFVNVTNHWKKHPDVSKDVFLYDSKAKEKQLGHYEGYEGFKCKFCKRVVLGFKAHVLKIHPKDIDVDSKEFSRLEEECRIIPTNFQIILNQYQQLMTTTGVGKRNPVSNSVAATYSRQILAVIPSLNALDDHQEVNERLVKKVGSGSSSTKYAYLATLLNFLEFMQIDFPDVKKKEVEKLVHHTQRFLKRMRTAKLKQEQFVKETSRQKLKFIKNSFAAVKDYEKKSSTLIQSVCIRPSGSLTKEETELLYRDIFCRIICRLGCRSGIFPGMVHKELVSAEKTPSGNYSILIAKQKEKNRHGCIVINAEEYEHLQRVSDHAWALTKQERNENDAAFPSLSTTQASPMSSSYLSKIIKDGMKEIFGQPLTVTDVRKLITTSMRHQPADIQSAVARAEGHSLSMAQDIYNVAPAYEIVEKARFAMEEASKEQHDSPKEPDTSTLEKRSFATSEKDKHAETMSVASQDSGSTKVVRVKFLDDDLVLDVFRIQDLRYSDNKRIKTLEDIKMNSLCKARWPEDSLFYPARRIPSTSTPIKSRESQYLSDCSLTASPRKKIRITRVRRLIAEN